MRKPLRLSTAAGAPSDGLPACAIQDLSTVDMHGVSFLLVHAAHWKDAHDQLQQVRRNGDPRIYTKPVLFQDIPDGIPAEIAQAADGIIRDSKGSPAQTLSDWSARVEPFNARIDQLKALSIQGDRNIAFKVLRFIETRDVAFAPLPSAGAKSGYLYPLLQPLFPKEDFGVLETLQYLESQKLLEGQFSSRSYACTHCGCAFLNFFETCPDCGSGDLQTEELIHHFKCAYVGEMGDFRQGERLVCPKCDRLLKHIGVDYDKASVVYHCRNCSNVFQEPVVMTSCYNCLRETPPENQVSREIKAYTLTAIGKNAALYGMDSLLQSILETKIHAFSFDVFKAFFNLEVARIERYKVSRSCFVIMRIRGIDKIYGRLGSRAGEIFNELSEALKNGLRSSDVFSVRDETIFLVILTETSPRNAGLAISRLKGRILSLLESSMKMEFTIDEEVHPLSRDLSLEDSIEQFLKTHAD